MRAVLPAPLDSTPGGGAGGQRRRRQACTAGWCDEGNWAALPPRDTLAAMPACPQCCVVRLPGCLQSAPLASVLPLTRHARGPPQLRCAKQCGLPMHAHPPLQYPAPGQ